MSTELRTKIKLRKDIEANWISANPVLLDGEVCLVVCTNLGNAIRVKIGDGVKTYSALPFLDDDSLYKHYIINGYLLNGEFYRDSTYQLTYEKTADRLYIDRNTRKLYYYDCLGAGCTNTYKEIEVTFPTASDSIAGIMKLYNTSGQNVDGTMTQKCITDGIKDIRFDVDTGDSEMLVLHLPW